MVNYQERLDRTFAALVDPTRRAILARLEREDGTSVSELARPFAIKLPAVMKHLDVLDDAGLITRSKIGRTVTVRLSSEPMREAMNWLRRHFEHNDVSFVAVSRGPIEKLQAYRKRVGWTFRWVSSADSDFNFDYHVSFPEGTRERGVFYNFEQQPNPEMDELSGVSVFYKDEHGTIYHTYSTYGRGGEVFMPVYGWLDVVPKGRNENKRGNLVDWVKRHDRYEDDGRSRTARTATAGAS
jgi:DNA-binding transcriptional ArsR family regulator